MPCYHLSRAHLSAEVDKLEQRGERVVSIVPDGSSIIVVTERVRYMDFSWDAAPHGGLEHRGE